MGVDKSSSMSQRHRRKMREAKALANARLMAPALGGAGYKYVDFEDRPYANKVPSSYYEELRRATTKGASWNLPKRVPEIKVRKYLAERMMINNV